MKKTILKSILKWFILWIGIKSYNKNNNTTAAVAKTYKLFYTEGVAATMSTLTCHFAVATSQNVFAKTGKNTILEINFDSILVGAYTN